MVTHGKFGVFKVPRVGVGRALFDGTIAYSDLLEFGGTDGQRRSVLRTGSR